MTRDTTILLVVVLTLVLIGMLTVYSTGAVTDGVEHLQRQGVYVAIGLLGMLFALHFDYHRFRNPFVYRPLVLLAVALLLLVLIPGIGVERGGARRWIQVAGMTFQPSELAKFILVLLLSVKMTENQSQIRKFWRGVVPVVMTTWVFTVLILAERDLGVPAVLTGVALLIS